MREFKYSFNLIGISVIILILIFAMLLTSEEFFDRSNKASDEVYTAISNNLHEIDLRSFKITTPKDFYLIYEQGIDSYVGTITNEKDSIFFDYGWYSNSLDDPKFERSYDTINGSKVIVASKGNGIVGVHFPRVKGENKLTLFGSFKSTETAYNIYKSIKIPGKSGYTSTNLGSNVSYGYSKAEQLFNQNCGMCHSVDMVIIGPRLSGVLERKGTAWFESWVNNPADLIENNEEAEELYKSYSEIEHPAYDFSQDEIQQLINFVSAKEKEMH